MSSVWVLLVVTIELVIRMLVFGLVLLVRVIVCLRVLGMDVCMLIWLLLKTFVVSLFSLVVGILWPADVVRAYIIDATDRLNIFRMFLMLPLVTTVIMLTRAAKLNDLLSVVTVVWVLRGPRYALSSMIGSCCMILSCVGVMMDVSVLASMLGGMGPLFRNVLMVVMVRVVPVVTRVLNSGSSRLLIGLLVARSCSIRLFMVGAWLTMLKLMFLWSVCILSRR